MRTVSARAVPPPPSSVVTNTLPISSAAVSNMPTASISSIFIEQGAENASTAAKALASCALSGRMCAAQKGRKSSVLPPEWKSSTMSARGSSSRWK